VKIKKANIKRLASLSALGAGALSVTGGTTEASSIVFSGPVNAEVGRSPGLASKASFSGPNGAGAMLQVAGFGVCVYSCQFSEVVKVSNHPGRYGTNVRFLGAPGTGLITAFPQGAKFGAPAASRSVSRGAVAFRGSSITYHSRFHSNDATEFNATDQYLLFEFTGGHFGQAVYGWAQLNVTFTNTTFLTGAGPDVTLVDWAYDISGAQIPAGDTGTPEPSTFALTGLAALALGAKGVRSWREARKTAVAEDAYGS
jgi:hypothetical protein